MKSSTAAYFLTLLVVVTAFAGILTTGPPPVVPASAPADQFSAARALDHVRVIAREPHPMGTEAHAEVREYLLETLRAHGLEPQLQDATVVSAGGRSRPAAARVVNVLGRLVGRERGPAVLLVAHYDSVPNSPGASDDGSGVAALLETLRALRAGPQLRNDVIFLFTDGEEAGLLGARAFAEQHPWIDDVGAVVNFEARGTRGPSLMFETSDGNSRLIGELRRAMGHPRATSYSYEIYKLLPNDTDFSVFRRRGLPGMNFAFIHGATAYHTAQDSFENLDPRSLQHHGEAALGLARGLGEADLGTSWATGNSVYFNLLGSWFITYPAGWVWPLAGLAVLATLAVVVVGRRRGRLQVGRLLLAVLAQLLVAVLFGGLGLGLSGLLFSFYNFSSWGGATSYSLTLLGLALAVIALTIVVGRWLIRKLGSENLTAAGLIVWLILTLAIAKLAPGADYLFVWPVLLGALAALVAWSGGEREQRSSWPALGVLALHVVIATLLWAPTLALLGVALGGPAAVAVNLFVVLLLCGLLTPLLALSASWSRGWLVPALLLVLGLGLVVAVKAGSTHGERNRRMTSLFYVFDRSAGTARWYSYDRVPDRWVSEILGREAQRGAPPAFLGGGSDALQQSAPAGPYEGPRISQLEERVEGEVWQLDFTIGWPWLAHRASFDLGPKSRIRSLVVGGQRVEVDRAAEGAMNLGFFAPPAEGVRFSVEVDGTQPLQVGAVSQRYGLPSFDGLAYPPRPETTMPAWSWSTDSTFVSDQLIIELGALDQQP